MVKKIAIAIWILTATFLGILIINYYGNQKLISNYGEGVYQQNELGFLGFTQPYINHFNRGNIYYQLGDYEKDKQEYQMALNLMPPDPYDCKIRVNYALSHVTPIDVKSINEDNYKDVIEICETAKAILAEKDCATENNDGHYYAAQKLYNEINEFEEQLRQQYENPPTPTPDPNDPNNQNTDTPTPTPTPEGSPKPDADHTDTPTPTPTPQGDTGTPTPTPQGGTDTPTPTPSGDTGTPTPSPADGSPTPTPGDGTPTPTPGDDPGDTGTPTPTPGDNPGDTGTPTPTPGGDPGNSGTPTPTPGGDPSNSGTPTPTPGGQGTGTPTPTPGGSGGNSGTPTPTPGGNGGNNGTPTPTPSPEDKIKDIQDRANRTRYGEGDDYWGSDDWNFGDSASW